VDNFDDGSERTEVLIQTSRAEQLVDMPGLRTRTFSETRRMPCWVMMVVCVAGGDSLRIILSVVAGHAY